MKCGIKTHVWARSITAQAGAPLEGAVGLEAVCMNNVESGKCQFWLKMYILQGNRHEENLQTLLHDLQASGFTLLLLFQAVKGSAGSRFVLVEQREAVSKLNSSNRNI